ncbi:hypothetical protein Q9L58_007063 [Maublancomyces gigas]|uniref:Uncharacterized protein n=1 Tax=Discina gigas TaxID=1032678 RepID=A0ABR3GE31_9PEZI
MPILWTICHQVAYFHDLFVDKVTATSVDPTCAKVLQKNLMFKMSEEALIIAGEFADLVHGYLVVLELGQRFDPNWSIESSTAFKILRQYTGPESVKLFGTRIGAKLNCGEVYRPPHVPSSRHASKGPMQGISAEENDLIVKGITYKIGDWNKAIARFIRKFDPYCLQVAVQLMLETANRLRKAAEGVIKLVERTYRIALGMRPIEGTSEAEMVYLAIVKEHGTDLKAEVKMGLENVVSRAGSQLELMLERTAVRGKTMRQLSEQTVPAGRRMSMDVEEWYTQ